MSHTSKSLPHVPKKGPKISGKYWNQVMIEFTRSVTPREDVFHKFRRKLLSKTYKERQRRRKVVFNQIPQKCNKEPQNVSSERVAASTPGSSRTRRVAPNEKREREPSQNRRKVHRSKSRTRTKSLSHVSYTPDLRNKKQVKKSKKKRKRFTSTLASVPIHHQKTRAVEDKHAAEER